jgi:ribonuclease R
MSVAEFGFFVRLDRFLVDGLVHESSLNDRYRFNARRQELQGQRTGRRWRAGDRVTVRIVRLDMISAKLDLELA